MSIKFLDVSTQRKTGNIPQTYRSGGQDMYGSCPDKCPLKPVDAKTASEVDEEYARALAKAVPRNGISFSYSHFPPDKWKGFGFNKPKRTTLNFSASTQEEAVQSFKDGIPTVWAEKNPSARKVDGVQLMPCPADKHDHIQCANCGGSAGPLCARPDRKFIVVFKWKQWKKIPCYAANGYVKFTWKNTGKILSNMTDGERVLDWVKKLPFGSTVRHHVAGDIGKVGKNVR